MEAVLVKLPEVPVMVTGKVPVVAVLLAVNVKALDPVVLVGLKVAITPLGSADADKLTLPLNPFCGVTVMLLGEAARAKLGAGKVMDTLSKVAVVRRVLSLLLMAKPTKTFWAMVMVWLEPTWAQFRPSGEA